MQVTDYQKGQVVLLVVLVMVVALTVSLSLAARSLINLKNTTDEANSQKAFAAAEAGIEQATKLNQNQSGIFFANEQLNNSDSSTLIKQVTVSILQDSKIALNNGNPVLQDDGADLWLSNYPDYSGTPWSGKLYVYWGTSGTCTDPALEMIVLSGSGPNPKSNATITRYASEAFGCVGRPAHNKLPSANAGSVFNGKTYKSVDSICIKNGLLVRLLPLYAGTPIAVWGRATDVNCNETGSDLSFPTQGRTITSVGQSGTTKRKISFFQGYESIPSEYFYSLFQQ